MKDSHIGTYGVLGLLFYFGLLWNLLSTLSLSLACMAVASGDAWSKFCSAQIINILPYARKEEESKAKVIYDRMSISTWLPAFIAGGLPMWLFLNRSYWWAALAPLPSFSFYGNCCASVCKDTQATVAEPLSCCVNYLSI